MTSIEKRTYIPSYSSIEALGDVVYTLSVAPLEDI